MRFSGQTKLGAAFSSAFRKVSFFFFSFFKTSKNFAIVLCGQVFWYSLLKGPFLSELSALLAPAAMET